MKETTSILVMNKNMCMTTLLNWWHEVRSVCDGNVWGCSYGVDLG